MVNFETLDLCSILLIYMSLHVCAEFVHISATPPWTALLSIYILFSYIYIYFFKCHICVLLMLILDSKGRCWSVKYFMCRRLASQ